MSRGGGERLATLLEGRLLEGAGLAFDISKVFKISKINYGCFKTVKLVKKVIIVINGVPTSYLWRKNQEKGLSSTFS